MLNEKLVEYLRAIRACIDTTHTVQILFMCIKIKLEKSLKKMKYFKM